MEGQHENMNHFMLDVISLLEICFGINLAVLCF